VSYFKHETALVDEGALIGAATKIWHWVHVSSGAVVGSNCILGQNVFIGNKVIIGNNVKIQNNVSVYDNVSIEDDVFCGPSMVFTNVYNPRAFVNRKDEFKNTLVKRGATLGANCTVICGIIIGEYAFVGAGAVVTKDVAPFALMAGVPAKQTGWMTRFGEKIALPVVGSGEYICSKTGDVYVLKGNSICLQN
jgi:UDP-2-acetamido-3-amino-2,3-dideoxy-glucuronate N-acetyltransferase